MLDAPIRQALAAPLNTAADKFQRLGVGPNALIGTGFVLGLVAATAIASESYLIGLLFLLLNRLADGIEGALVRRTGATPLSDFLDTISGVAVPLGIAFAYAVSRQQNGLAAAFLMMGLTLVVVTNLAARAFARPAATIHERPLVICEQSETFIVFVLMALVPWAFALFAYAYGGLCLISAAMRFATAVPSSSNTAKS